VGVYDIDKFRHGLGLAKSMHNMISIKIDYGHALNLVQSETNDIYSKKHGFEGRMRDRNTYIAPRNEKSMHQLLITKCESN
jgi:hypothetical protein